MMRGPLKNYRNIVSVWKYTYVIVKVSLQETCRAARQEEISKAIPLQPLTDPEGSRRLRLPDFKTINT
jgi:hypothetical protein